MASEHPPRRDRCGRFATTRDPGLTHWPALPYRNHVPIEIWLEILDQANELVTVMVEGRRPERVTRLEATLIELGSGPGQNFKHLSDFVRLAIWAGHYVEKADAVEHRRQLDRADMAIIEESMRPNSGVDWPSALRRWAKRQIADLPDNNVARNLRRR